MRRHIPQAGYALIGGLFFLVLSFAPHAAEIEQVEALYVHTVAGTVDVAGGFLKGGKNFDGGDAAFLMKWDDTDPGFSGHVQSWLDCRRNGGEHDGSFSVHQMVTAWDETTDFGTSIPLAGVDYSPNPIASVGFNNGDGVPSPYEDLADLSALVNYWIANAGKNHGLIFVPRGQLNSSYTGTFGNEIMLPAHERVAGLDSDDTRISAYSPGDGPVTGIEDAIVEVDNVEAGRASMLEGLRPDLEYEIIVRVDSCLGKGPWSAVCVLPTYHAIPAVPTLARVAATPSSVTVAWHAPEQEPHKYTYWRLERADIPFRNLIAEATAAASPA